MGKHPIHYTAEDFSLIKGKSLQIDIGPSEKDEIRETINCKLTKVTLSANSPHLPVLVYLDVCTGNIVKERRFDVMQLKSIKVL
jgi:hypothetical protein